MPGLFPLPRLLVFCFALLVIVGCTASPLATMGGADPASLLASPQPVSPQPKSPLPTPNPNLAVYEIAIIRGAKEQLLEDVVRVKFNSSDWQSMQDHVWNNILVNREDPTCILLQPTGDPAEPDPSVARTVQLGERQWTVHVDNWSTDTDRWLLRYRSAPYEFTLMMLNYVEPVTEATGRACIAATEALLASFALAPAANQPTTADAENKPRVWLKADENATGEPIIPDLDALVAESAAWPLYTSENTGITFHYPPGWSVNEADYPAIFLAPPDGDRWRNIWFTWVTSEKPLDRSLRAWMEESAGSDTLPRFQTIAEDRLPITDPSGTSEQARLDNGPVFVGDSYLISHGNLVLHVSTYSAWVDAPAQLRAVASSIEFAEDAPTSFADIPWQFTPKDVLPTPTP